MGFLLEKKPKQSFARVVPGKEKHFRNRLPGVCRAGESEKKPTRESNSTMLNRLWRGDCEGPCADRSAENLAGVKISRLRKYRAIARGNYPTPTDKELFSAVENRSTSPLILEARNDIVVFKNFENNLGLLARSVATKRITTNYDDDDYGEP